MTSDILVKELEELKSKAQRFFQVVNAIEIKHSTREMEIKNLESKIELLKKTEQENSLKASVILQQATEQASDMKRQANQLMEEANKLKQSAKEDREQADRAKVEAQNLLKQAEDKQRSADAQWHLLNERDKKIKAAVGL